jgi:hypothetical protein
MSILRCYAGLPAIRNIYTTFWEAAFLFAVTFLPQTAQSDLLYEEIFQRGSNENKQELKTISRSKKNSGFSFGRRYRCNTDGMINAF